MARSDWLDRLDGEQVTLGQVTVGQKEIDKDEANEWLLRVKVDFQRSVSDSVVQRYVGDMNEGHWVAGAQLIVFDSRANLINGQHTLTAFVRSNLKTLPVIWQINRHPQAYMAFDHNRKRTPRDTLKWNGVERPGEIQSMATAIWAYEHGSFAGKSYQYYRSAAPSDSQVQVTVKMHPGLNQHLWKNPFRGKEFSIGGLNAASYILHCLDEKLAMDFFRRFIEGVNLPSRQHPIAALRRSFMDLERERLRAGETMARIFKAWNAFVRGEEVAGKLLAKNESFPEPINPESPEPAHPPAKGGKIN